MAYRALIFGLDGVTFDVVDPLIAAGKLPTLARLMERGVHAKLRSTCPPLSAPAWVTFLTGKNPGKHGVFNFQTLDARDYSGFGRSLVNSSHFRGTTLIDHVGRTSAVRSLAYRIPMTYPPWDIPNGVLVSGFPVPDRRRTYARPVEVEAAIGSANPSSYDEMVAATERRDIAVIEGSNRFELETLERTTETYLSRGYELIVAFTGIPDTLHHAFWSYYDPQSPAHDAAAPAALREIIEHWYAAIDATMGRIIARIDQETAVIVLSDHGGGPAPVFSVGFNAFLRQHGHLVVARGGRARTAIALRRALERAQHAIPGRFWLKSHLPARLTGSLRGLRSATGAVDWGQTRAYATPIYYPVTGIWVNVKGRQPKGAVDPGREYETLRRQLVHDLESFRDPDTGRAVVQHVAYREDVYPGSRMEDAPDLVVTTVPGYHGGPDLERLVTPVPSATLRATSGSHTADGVFIAAGGPFRKTHRLGPADLADVLPTALYLLDVTLPDDLDGRVLTEAFEDEHVQRNPLRLAAADAATRDAETLGDAEQAEMRKFLQGLGYLE